MPHSEASLEAAARCLSDAGIAGPFACALVTGTGLGGLSDALEAGSAIDYARVPGFPQPRVSGHGGRLLCGSLAGRRVLVFEGRSHAYESGDPCAMGLPIALARHLGAGALLLTSAVGSLDAAAGPGSLVQVSDHINLAGMNPLIGEPSDRRFVAMNDAYDPDLRNRLHAAAAECGVRLHEGVYAWFAGPSFETPAEVLMAGRLGATLVGMSIVPEVILARFHELPVAAVCVVTNHAAGVRGGDPQHEETKTVAARASADLVRLATRFVARLPASPGSREGGTP